ncbi:hypothetical protein PI95_000765 [Hassallia byssoidea VB512170]|uniref:Uncharacterized protein n=1 Tax=Hassallia byssoidea VB512170 TaxID=1304833 RepID=A0A846H3F8_9CYAN|nr:hypothetical protein [Hassalia byssoidea]NEU71144.1 hypothetical protein [Hassalia byssoidea VB512170]
MVIENWELGIGNRELGIGNRFGFIPITHSLFPIPPFPHYPLPIPQH